ncbi:MAG: hypothetical protein R3286_07730 [Gammaproteobacteria bacterium]|nr:hypothetical protein [Gammaproteobacteria bacterium]
MLNPLRWLPGKDIDEFSRALAHDLAARYSLAMANAAPGKKSEKKLGRALSHVYARAREFRAARRLGVYGTARLGNSFKWELKEMGYRPAFIEEVTKGLILNVRGR